MRRETAEAKAERIIKAGSATIRPFARMVPRMPGLQPGSELTALRTPLLVQQRSHT